MRGFLYMFCATALPLAALSVPASAAPAAPRAVVSQDGGGIVHQVQDLVPLYDPRFHPEGYRLRGSGGDRGRWEHRGGHAYYNNHRGYRQYRRGYRQHNGYWFPPAAFVAGAILGGALSAGQPPRGGSNAHMRWCASQYRSYRAFDNTFQPYNGPRRQCVSPYMR